MGAYLGSLGVAHTTVVEEEEPDTFEWFGSQVRLIGDYNETDLIDLLEDVRSLDVNNPTSAVVVKDLLRSMVHPGDFDAFWALGRKNRQRIEDWAQLGSALMEFVTGRPTRQPSDSSVGRLTTTTSSQDGSSSLVSRGRPDLQIIVDDDQATRDRARAWAAAG